VRLLDIERAAHGLKRRHAVHTRIEEVFRQEWRDLDALLAERTAGRLDERAESGGSDDEYDHELPLFPARASE